MGMFDSVYAKCPKCGKDVEFQSKAGERVLMSYTLDAVPVQIAADLDRTAAYCGCGQSVTIEIPGTLPPPTVPMVVRISRD